MKLKRRIRFKTAYGCAKGIDDALNFYKRQKGKKRNRHRNGSRK